MTKIRGSRRQFLTTSAATAATAFIPSVLKTAMAATPAGSSLSAVKHVVIFMQENRSFDHYYGSLQGVRGFNDRTALTLRNGNTVFKQPSGSSYEMPFHLDTTATSAQCMSDLDHSWTGTHSAWDNAKYDNWVAAKGSLTMGYYTRADIPFHYAMADAFTICDNYFCSIMGPTNPNRLYLWSGMIDPNGTGGGPITNNDEPGFSWTTYPERLQAAGVSWKVYQKTSDNFDDNALAWFTQYRNAAVGSPLYNNGMSSVPVVTGNTVSDIVAAIKNDVLNNTLPQVSWVVAPASASEHPSNPPANGADMVSQVLGALTSNPTVWASTVMFLNYDENDGYFDHIVPPVPAAGTASEFVSGVPIGLGPRVPMTVISPWSRGGYVNSQVFDHTSVIRFLETWTGVQEPNISAWRRLICGDLTSTLNFNSTTVSVPSMPNTAALAQQAATQCSTLPAPTAPLNQITPLQEFGTRLACALPYQPNGTSLVAKSTGIVWITMTNTGSQAVHHSIYANNYRSDGPWQYDVAANGSVKDYFHVQTYGGGYYDLSLYGPNGFMRRFVGNINTAAGGLLEVTSSYSFATAGNAQLLLTMVNNTTASVTFTVTSNGYRTDGPWTCVVAAGATVSSYWNVQTVTSGWYDFTATVNADSSFSRRFAGHVELGGTSITG
ncbi:phosphocholine-specific phospholipase C [Solimicrobium silvestre]|uniref:phospholipase C n=1 Tax=Solimicrobium silvestre TaxID=2099400 RepID=A0A2S9H2K3_9BURK|nr:phospholipase C, phosphocholine-specific [Solimicrobium silvestre]PRC94096.1 Phospholipase C, phosphocholine-specific [Solimicrobium silvestre]